MSQQRVGAAGTPNSYFFYLVTITHGVHLALGLLALTFAMFAMFRLRRVELRQAAVDSSVWYWHAMGAFWGFIFLLLVCSQK
jgi:cytochrome c oxidase subunit III